MMMIESLLDRFGAWLVVPMVEASAQRVMLDIETFGTRPGCVIVSIGAVRINGTEVTDDRFEVNVDPGSCVRHGLEMDPSTVNWWLTQDREAVRRFQDDPQSLPDALDRFAEWIGKVDEVWGNGSDFDNAILCAAYEMLGSRAPWPTFGNRCYRTVKSLCPEIRIQRTGTYHSALDDAVSQANHLVACLDAISR